MAPRLNVVSRKTNNQKKKAAPEQKNPRNTITCSNHMHFHAVPLDGVIKTEQISFHVFKNETCKD